MFTSAAGEGVERLPAGGTAVSRTARNSVAAGLALLAAASLLTQAWWIATGDAFGLGLVPAFNPAGVGNIPVFALTAALAVSAAWTGVAAAALRVHGRANAIAWTLLAVVQALLSLQQLTIPRPRLGGDPGWLAVGYATPPVLVPRDAILFAGIAVCGFVVALACRGAGAARGKLLGAAVMFAAGSALGAVAGVVQVPAIADARIAPAMLTVAAVVLELAGIALAFAAATARLASVAPNVRLVVVDQASHTLTAHAPPGGLELRLAPRRIAGVIATIIAGLLVASVVVTWAYARWPEVNRAYRLLYVDAEGNVPTWWSAMLLLASGVLTALVAASSRASGDRRWLDWAWLALLFAALAADESASLHELLQKPVRALLGAENWLRYPLIVPGVIAAAAITLRFRTLMRTLAQTRRELAVGAAIFALGALGVETVGGWYAPEAIGRNLTYLALTTIEEGCEMTGAAVVLISLLRHLRRAAVPVGLRLRAR
jgi:hypothetical protein